MGSKTNVSETNVMDAAHVARFFSYVVKQQCNAVAQFGSVYHGVLSKTALNRFCMVACSPTDSVVLKQNTLYCNLKSEQQTQEVSDATDLFTTLRQIQVSQSDPWAWKTWALQRTTGSHVAKFELNDVSEQQVSAPCQGGWAGVLGYPFYRWCDEAFAKHHSAQEPSVLPDLVMHRFSDWLVWDHHQQTLSLFSCRENANADYQAHWRQSAQASDRHRVEAEVSDFIPTLREAAFCDRAGVIQHHVLEGDLYQANLSVGFNATVKLRSPDQHADLPSAVFDQLMHTNPSPFSGLYRFDDTTLISNSPERLVRVQPDDAKGMRVDTRPIAGTRRRGKTDAEDKANEAELLTSSKEQAEHLMLVDLERNDLGRVCTAGSVAVDELLVVERYSHVMHLVSNVAGQLKPECDMWDVLQSTFPGGTITGCPKIRCIQTLDTLEPASRGWYTGSMFYWDERSGAFDSSILIRSIVAQHDAKTKQLNVSLQVGAGIVADSVPAHEYKESLSKGQASFNAIARVLGRDESDAVTKVELNPKNR